MLASLFIWFIIFLMDLEREHPRERQEAEALEAVESYLRYGNQTPPLNALQELIGIMRVGSSDLYVRTTCAGAYVDLARHPHTTPAEAEFLIDKSIRRIGGLAAMDWREMPPEHRHYIYKAGLHVAYGPKYKKALTGQTPDMEDEADLYAQLLELGRKSLAPGSKHSEWVGQVRGIQFEIGVHLLNARFNIRHQEILQSVWPSTPREDDPHDFSYVRTAWDMAVTTGSFLDQSDCFYVQLKGEKDHKDGRRYDPAIMTITGKDDLYTRTSADLIALALEEGFPTESVSDLQLEQIGAKLNMHERYFLQRLGWQF